MSERVLIAALAAAGLLIAVLASLLLLQSSAEEEAPAEKPGKQAPLSKISEPLDGDQLKEETLQRIPAAFWLGAPRDGEEARLDRAPVRNAAAIGYQSAEQAENFDPGAPQFEWLLISETIPDVADREKLLRKSAGEVRVGDGYILALPPKNAYKQRRLIALSREQGVIAIIISGSPLDEENIDAMSERLELIERS